MHFHPDSVLPFAQLQRARPARHTKVPVAAAGAPGQFALTSNDETALAALLEDLPGGELEIQFEHGSCDRRSEALAPAISALFLRSAEGAIGPAIGSVGISTATTKAARQMNSAWDYSKRPRLRDLA